MNINKNFCGVFVAMAALCGATMFAGCGDDNSASVDDEQSSSSVETPASSSSADAKSSSSSKEDKTAESSSSVKDGEASGQSSSSVTDPLVEKFGKCEDKGQFEVSHVQDDAGNWYSCYRGEWSEGFLEVEGPEWGKNPGDISSSSAKSDSGIVFSKDVFLNPEIKYDSIVDERDGQVYKTVKIGDQLWMAQNLNYADTAKTPSLRDRNWCFDNDTLKCALYGRLYTWAAAIDSQKIANDVDHPQLCGYTKVNDCALPDAVQGICPKGWHLPSLDEWNMLVKTVADSSAMKLKSLAGWMYDGNGFDKVGFSAAPSGHRNNLELSNCNRPGSNCVVVEFSGLGDDAYFWTATSDNSREAYEVYLGSDREEVKTSQNVKLDGRSIRCLKD